MSLKILLISHSIFHLLYGSRRICTQVCQGCTFNALTCCLGRQLTRFWNKAVVCVCQCLGLKDLGQFSLLYLNSLLLSNSKPAAHRKITQGAILIFSCYVSVLSALSCSSFHFLSCQLLFRSLEGERLMQTGGLWCNPGPRKLCRSKSMFRILRVSLGLDAPWPACSPAVLDDAIIPS